MHYVRDTGGRVLGQVEDRGVDAQRDVALVAAGEDGDGELVVLRRVHRRQMLEGVLVADVPGVHLVKPPVLQLGRWMGDRQVVERGAVVLGPLCLGEQRNGSGFQRAQQEVSDELLAHHQLDVEPRSHPRLIDHDSLPVVRKRGAPGLNCTGGRNG